MIATCPKCDAKEQIRREGDQDLTDVVCDGCGLIYEVSLVRMEAREEVHTAE